MAHIRAIFRKHFDGNGNGDDYPTDFFNPSRDLDDLTFVEMRPPESIDDFATDHDHEVFYCPACRMAFGPNEVEWKLDNGRYLAECPGVGDTPCAAVNEDTQHGPTIMTADEHLEVCKSGFGEEEWDYETEFPDAIESDLQRCETVIRYERLADVEAETA